MACGVNAEEHSVCQGSRSTGGIKTRLVRRRNPALPPNMLPFFSHTTPSSDNIQDSAEGPSYAVHLLRLRLLTTVNVDGVLDIHPLAQLRECSGTMHFSRTAQPLQCNALCYSVSSAIYKYQCSSTFALSCRNSSATLCCSPRCAIVSSQSSSAPL